MNETSRKKMTFSDRKDKSKKWCDMTDEDISKMHEENAKRLMEDISRNKNGNASVGIKRRIFRNIPMKTSFNRLNKKCWNKWNVSGDGMWPDNNKSVNKKWVLV